MAGLIYLLFFISGISGLIYQVIWVRMFGNVFGNTIHSASLVVALFMLGLGAGSYLVGRWADRRYATQPDSMLRAYGYVELVIAAMGLAIALILPHLGALSALVSSYSREASGWYVLSPLSYAARGAIAIVLLTPIAVLMGGTLTLLIRHLVRADLAIAGWRIAVLYGMNTAGAALGALLTDFVLVPTAGLFGTQMVAVGCNVLAAVGALALARAVLPAEAGSHMPARESKRQAKKRADAAARSLKPEPRSLAPEAPSLEPGASRAVVLTSVALALTGLAAMGMEILWFRHFTMLLGGFRAVFSLLLAVILVGIGVGSVLGGVVQRRTGRPGEWFMAAQALFVATTLAGFAVADVRAVDAAADAAQSGAASTLVELWFNIRPILMEVGLPALLMGFSFPLANGLIQRTEAAVGRRAGALYFANTAGAVCGSLAAGFLLLPSLGLQASATVLMAIAVLAIVPLFLATAPDGGRRPVPALAVSLLVGGIALGAWLQLPADHVTTRSMPLGPNEKVLTITDGLTEVIAVTETPSEGRVLMTNGHQMSSTRPLSQRYMRALAHIPLLAIERPETVLVIGFGVGNTTQAVTLHPTVTRVDLADLSRDILAHADYFAAGNKGVLKDPRVAVHINDGRQHLQMQPPATYDLITLEPPPIGYAGVSALYSTEFYALARGRLKRGGYISQWLPAYQVPPETTLAMVRAFIDVFPQAVLLSGAGSDLLLLGVNDDYIQIDPAAVRAALARAPAVQADLERVYMGRVHEIIGSFVGSAQTLSDATLGVAPVTDDRPVQEYSVRSMLNFGRGVPGTVVNLRDVAAWCPRCFAGGQPAPGVEDLDAYLAIMELAYAATPAEMAGAMKMAQEQGRTIAGNPYLGMVVPESAALHNVIGITLASRGLIGAAAAEFRQALALDPNMASTHWHLGAALASQAAPDEAMQHLRRSIELDPAQPAVHNDLGLLLAQQGRMGEAIEAFQRALALDPNFEDARQNLAQAQQQRGGA
jgi:spermidine synthase